jgi:hypothetical protein
MSYRWQQVTDVLYKIATDQWMEQPRTFLRDKWIIFPNELLITGEGLRRRSVMFARAAISSISSMIMIWPLRTTSSTEGQTTAGENEDGPD